MDKDIETIRTILDNPPDLGDEQIGFAIEIAKNICDSDYMAGSILLSDVILQRVRLMFYSKEQEIKLTKSTEKYNEWKNNF